MRYYLPNSGTKSLFRFPNSVKDMDGDLNAPHLACSFLYRFSGADSMDDSVSLFASVGNGTIKSPPPELESILATLADSFRAPRGTAAERFRELAGGRDESSSDKNGYQKYLSCKRSFAEDFSDAGRAAAMALMKLEEDLEVPAGPGRAVDLALFPSFEFRDSGGGGGEEGTEAASLGRELARLRDSLVAAEGDLGFRELNEYLLGEGGGCSNGTIDEVLARPLIKKFLFYIKLRTFFCVGNLPGDNERHGKRVLPTAERRLTKLRSGSVPHR